MPKRQLFDPGLQPERTALAWRRTGLALTVASLVAVRILPEILGVWVIVLAGIGVLLSVSVLIAAHRRHVATHRILLGSDPDRVPLTTGWLPLTVAVLVAVGGVAALAMTIVGAGAH